MSPLVRQIGPLLCSKARQSGLVAPLSRYEPFFRVDSWAPRYEMQLLSFGAEVCWLWGSGGEPRRVIRIAIARRTD